MHTEIWTYIHKAWIKRHVLAYMGKLSLRIHEYSYIFAPNIYILWQDSHPKRIVVSYGYDRSELKGRKKRGSVKSEMLCKCYGKINCKYGSWMNPSVFYLLEFGHSFRIHINYKNNKCVVQIDKELYDYCQS